MSDPSDEDLISQIRAGDAKAADLLLARHEARIYRFGLRLCGNEADARDVLQETLLTAFKNMASFRGDSQLSTWLYHIARSHCIKARRKRENEPHLHESLDAPEVKQLSSDDSSDENRAHARQVGEVIQAAMNTLPVEHREALVLRDVEGLSAEEAAHVVGIEVAALKSRLHRGRVALKQKLASVLDDETADFGCAELQATLSKFANSEIDQSTCEHIEAHLETCAVCNAACESLKQTVSLCRALPTGEVPASVRAAVRKALRQASVGSIGAALS